MFGPYSDFQEGVDGDVGSEFVGIVLLRIFCLVFVGGIFRFPEGCGWRDVGGEVVCNRFGENIFFVVYVWAIF